MGKLTKVVQFRTDRLLYEALQEQARRQMLTPSAVIRRAVARELGLFEGERAQSDEQAWRGLAAEVAGDWPQGVRDVE